MPPATSRAVARAAFLDALAAAGLEPELRARAVERRAEAERLAARGARVAEARDELARRQALAAEAALPSASTAALGRAVLRAGIDVLPAREAHQAARERADLERELAGLAADRGLVARARTKPRRLRIAARIDALRAGQGALEAALGRTLVAGGWLDDCRHPDTDAALDAVRAALPPDVAALGALRAALQLELELAAPPTALDLRPLLSRTRAEEGAAREAADGAETEAIEAALARRGSLPAPLRAAADALLAARAAEHEAQRQALEAQLAAIEEEEGVGA
jgi:hypothetical protein